MADSCPVQPDIHAIHAIHAIHGQLWRANRCFTAPRTGRDLKPRVTPW
jgi:hypothetical protein